MNGDGCNVVLRVIVIQGISAAEARQPELNRIKTFFLPTFWGTSNPELVAQKAKDVSELAEPGFHFADNFFTWCRNNSMLEDEVFVNAWQSNVESTADTAIVWRRYILACAAYHCVQLKGDFVECGAYTGVGVKTVVDFLGGVRFPKGFLGLRPVRT